MYLNADEKPKKLIDTFMPEGEDAFAVSRLLESTNIAEQLSVEERKDIARAVVTEYEIDERSRQGWLERNEQWITLASMLMETKNTPWPNASNVKYPLLTQAVISFGARLYPALINGEKPVKARVVGKDEFGVKAESAIRVERHMSYQVLEEMEEWEEEMDRLIIVAPIVGDGFKKTYYNHSLGRNASEFVHPNDLCVNYAAKSLETAQRVTHIMEMSANDIHERIKDNRFLDVKLTAPNSSTLAKRRRLKDDINKTNPQSDDIELPRVVLEQHRWLDLDGDGYKEPYIVTVDYQDRELFRIVARYDADGITWTDDGKEVVRITPTKYFTKFPFIPNPDGGFYDMGFGLLLASLNEAANTLLNQLIDAGTLSNLQSGFLSRGIRIKGGKKRFAPGEWITVNTSGDDLKKGIFPLPVREPSMVLYTLLGFLIDAGQKLGQTTEILTGENPGQNQKATTTLAVIEQGLKVFNAIYKRFHRSLKQEFKILHRLNGLYLGAEEYFTIVGGSKDESANVFRVDYHSGLTSVIPYSDPNVSSEAQRLAKAQALMELQAAGFGMNPDVLKRRVLEAQDQPGIEELLKVEEPQPSLEQLKYELEKARHNHQVEMDAADLELRQNAQQSKSMLDETTALLKAVEAGMTARFGEIDRLIKILDGATGGKTSERSKAGSAGIGTQ